MPREIPFTGLSQESMSIVLDGRKLHLRVRYANLTNAWTIDIFDNSGESPIPIVSGIAIVMGVNLIKPYRHALPIGGIFAEPQARPREDAGRGELGNRIRLVHYMQAELDALKAT